MAKHPRKRQPRKRIQKLIEKFIQRVKPQDGVEDRIARKFGFVYAVGRIAVTEGILDWPKNLPFSVTKTLFRRAQALRCGSPPPTPPTPKLKEALDKLGPLLADKHAVPLAKPGKVLRVSGTASLIGIRTFYKKGKPSWVSVSRV